MKPKDPYLAAAPRIFGSTQSASPKRRAVGKCAELGSGYRVPRKRAMRTPPVMREAPRPGFAIGRFPVVAVDGAKHAPAWCAGVAGMVMAVGFDQNPGSDPSAWLPLRMQNGETFEAIEYAVLEAPRSYGARDSGKHGDIIAEAIGGALTVGALRARNVVQLHPDEWAGTASEGKGKAKPPRHRLLWLVLTQSERELIARATGFDSAFHLESYIEAACNAVVYGRKLQYKDVVHNILDAVGIYLYAVGRIKRGGGTRGLREAT